MQETLGISSSGHGSGFKYNPAGCRWCGLSWRDAGAKASAGGTNDWALISLAERMHCGLSQADRILVRRNYVYTTSSTPTYKLSASSLTGVLFLASTLPALSLSSRNAHHDAMSALPTTETVAQPPVPDFNAEIDIDVRPLSYFPPVTSSEL